MARKTTPGGWPKTELDDIAMMKDPDKWPRWPVLPLKHRTERLPGGFIKGGVMIEIGLDGAKPIVYLINMYELNGLSDTTPKIEYASFEKLAQDWMVD